MPTVREILEEQKQYTCPHCNVSCTTDRQLDTDTFESVEIECENCGKTQIHTSDWEQVVENRSIQVNGHEIVETPDGIVACQNCELTYHNLDQLKYADPPEHTVPVMKLLVYKFFNKYQSCPESTDSLFENVFSR